MSNAMFSRTFFRTIGIMIILNNCAPNRVAQPGFPTASPQEQIKPSLQDEWMPKQAPGIRQYLIEDSSTTLISDDPTHTSLLQTTTTYSLSLIALADSFSFTAKVDSMSTSSASSPRTSIVDKSFAQTVHGLSQTAAKYPQSLEIHPRRVRGSGRRRNACVRAHSTLPETSYQNW